MKIIICAPNITYLLRRYKQLLRWYKVSHRLFIL